MLHPASSNDAARAKTTEEETVPVIENFPMLNPGNTAFRIPWQSLAHAPFLGSVFGLEGQSVISKKIILSPCLRRRPLFPRLQGGMDGRKNGVRQFIRRRFSLPAPLQRGARDRPTNHGGFQLR